MINVSNDKNTPNLQNKLNTEMLPVASGPNGTFWGSPLEFAQFCNDQFNHETSFKGVLRRLVGMLSDWVGINSVSYLTLDTTWSPIDHRRNLVKFPPVSAIPDHDMISLRAALQIVVAGEYEVRQGFYQTQANGIDYYCVQFDEIDKRRGVLAWMSREPLEQTVTAILSGGTQCRSQEIVEFLVRSAQHAAHWLRRLDQTQSLLYQDEVTGLYNYRYLDVALDSEIRRLQRFHLPFSLLFIDLDNFKQVNDVHGHLTGSSVLKQVGLQIKAAVRDVDIVIRYGGDEFVVVLLGTNSQQALQAAERVRNRVDQQLYVTEAGDASVKITTSIGVACCPEHGMDKSTIIRLADETMYEAKKGGKNRVVMVKSSLKHDAIKANSSLRQNLMESIDAKNNLDLAESQLPRPSSELPDSELALPKGEKLT